MKMRVVIADDEALARERLQQFLRLEPATEVVAECRNGLEVVLAIRQRTPDLVFLDVKMPELDGFGVLEALKETPLPAVIFVTAHDTYALRAFEACATDYLLKPYTTQRFTQAVDRALRWIDSADRTENEERLKRLMLEVLQSQQSAPQSDGKSLDRFVAKKQGRTQFVSADEVDWIESDGNYIRLHVGAANHLVRGTIANCEERLDPRRFVRVHRRYIVNMERIREVQPWFGGDYVILLKNGQQVRLSRTYREHFQSRMRGG